MPESRSRLKALLAAALVMLVLSCNMPVQTEEELVQKDSALVDTNAFIDSQPTVEVCMEGKDFYSDAWHDYLIFDFALYNQNEKGIRALKGKVIFYNVFGEEQHQLQLSCEQQIPACGMVKQEVKMTFRPYVEKDVALKERPPEALEVQWFPERIIFTDNSTISFKNSIRGE